MIFILYPYRISNPVVRHFRRAVTQTRSVISIKGLIANVFNAAILLSQRKVSCSDVETALYGGGKTAKAGNPDWTCGLTIRIW